MTTTPTIGHNQPPAPLTPAEVNAYLDDLMAPLLARRSEIITALASSKDAYPRIEDETALGLVAENIRIAANLTSTSEKRRQEAKRPFLDGERAVDAWFRRFLEPLAFIRAPLQDAMDAYGKRKLAAERERLAAEREKAETAAREAAGAAIAVSARNRTAQAAAWDRADQAAQALEKVTRAEAARPAALTRSYGTYGAVASVRSSWSYEVTNPDAVPRAYLTVDHAAIKLAAKPRDAAGKPTAVIPGITWTEMTKMGVK